MNRYQELKKENDQLLNSLGDSYLRLATIYIKKARGFAVKNEDTEVKIRDTLYILKKYSDDEINSALKSIEKLCFLIKNK